MITRELSRTFGKLGAGRFRGLSEAKAKSSYFLADSTFVLHLHDFFTVPNGRASHVYQSPDVVSIAWFRSVLSMDLLRYVLASARSWKDVIAQQSTTTVLLYACGAGSR